MRREHCAGVCLLDNPFPIDGIYDYRIPEELDAEIEVGRLLETVEWDYPKFHLTMHCFVCTLLSEDMHLNEHDAAAWLTKETLHTVKWLPADEGLIQKIAAILEEIHCR